jgi:hypothetical protein
MYQLSLPLLGILIVLGLVLYRLNLLPWTRQTGSTRGPVRAQSQDASERNPYPAVSIRCANGCGAAQQLKGKRFLGNEAPPLPLADCDAQHCQCRYHHHVDRRTGNLDRRRLLGDKKEYVSFFGKEDPREGRGRRASDWAEAYRMNPPIS